MHWTEVRMRHPSAAQLLDMFGLFTYPVDVRALAARMGVDIYNLGRAQYSGALTINENQAQAGIFVNPFDSETRQRFTIAHEIGHLILHSLYGGDRVDGKVYFRDTSMLGSTQEHQANRFAADLLMPAQLVLLAKRQQGALATVEKLARVFVVSPQAMEIRLGVLV